MKKSLFTLTLFFLIALFISCTPIIKQDDLCQNDTNVIISLSQPAARFTSSDTYTLSDYTWKLIIYEQNRTIREQKDFNGGQTYQYQTKLEPAVYHISLTGTKGDSSSSNSAIPDTLQAEQTISVTEGEKVKNVILVPHSVYSGEGKLGIYIAFNLQDAPSVDLITVDAKLVNYYSKEEIPLKVEDFLITTTDNQETSARAYQLESTSSNNGAISVPSGLYKIYINLNYKVNGLDKTTTLVDDRVDNLLEVVPDSDETKTTSYELNLCSSTKLKYFTYHGSPSSENKGNGSSADAPAYLDDILKKRYSNPNILEIVINDTTSTLSTSEGTEVPPVPNVDVDLLQEGITYTLNFSKTENDYTYSLKKTSPGEIELTASCNSNDLPLRFTNSSSNHINITFTPDTDTDIPSITPSLGKGVSLTYDNSTSETGPSISIPSDLKYNPYYENIPYLIIKNPITESSDIPSQLTTSNQDQELDFSFATETTSDGSISIKKYYLTTYSSTKVPLYTIKDKIAYASLSNPDSFKYIEDADIAKLIDLTIDKDNNLYLLYKYTPEAGTSPNNAYYKVKKMPRDGNPSKTYIIDNIETGKTPISVKVGLDGEIYLILKTSSSSSPNHYFAKLKKNDNTGYDANSENNLSKDKDSKQENIITSTITADSNGNIYIAKGTTTTTTDDKKELLTYTLTKYTVNGDNYKPVNDYGSSFLQLSSVSSDNYYKTYNLEGDSELKELFYSGTVENGINTYTSNNYLKLSDCYIKGDYIYITVSLFNNACRGTILKINLSDGKIVETSKLIDKNVYSSGSYTHDEENFYGPSKIIAIKEDDLYIVDEGCIKNGSDETKKNSLIKLNLNNLSSLSRIKDIDRFDFSEINYSL